MEEENETESKDEKKERPSPSGREETGSPPGFSKGDPAGFAAGGKPGRFGQVFAGAGGGAPPSVRGLFADAGGHGKKRGGPAEKGPVL